MSTLTEISSQLIAGGVQKHYQHFSKSTQCSMKFVVFFPLEDITADLADKLPQLFWLVGYNNDETSLSEVAFQKHATKVSKELCSRTATNG